MNTDALVELFKHANRDTVSLIDALSVLSALADLNDFHEAENDLCSAALRILMENQSIDNCALFMKEADGMHLLARADSNEIYVAGLADSMNSKAVSLKTDEGIVGRVVSTGKIEHEQCKAKPEYFGQQQDDDLTQQEVAGIRTVPGSLMCVPLMNRQDCVGVLCVYRDKAEYFTATHEHFFKLFSRLFVQMLLSSRYLHDMERQIQERTEKLEQALASAQKLQSEFMELSMIEEQTGLPNRRFFCTEAQAALARARRHGRDFSCCLIEIGNFAEQEDEQGIFAVDRLLVMLADVLKLQVREGDILAHFRGAQFVVALPETDAEAAGQFAQRILSLIDEIHRGGGSELTGDAEVYLGLSSNIGELPKSNDEALQVLLQSAADALHAAQAAGRPIMHVREVVTPSVQGIA